MAKSLSDQLLNLGLVNEKQVKKAKHEQRQSNHKKGRMGVEAERAQRQHDATSRRRADRSHDREREVVRQASVAGHEAQARIKQIVESGHPGHRTDGHRRFYFETRDDRVSYLELNEETIDALRRSRYGIVESPHGQVSLVTDDAAGRVSSLDDAWVRFWHLPA